jgi:hypothetical protein
MERTGCMTGSYLPARPVNGSEQGCIRERADVYDSCGWLLVLIKVGKELQQTYPDLCLGNR